MAMSAKGNQLHFGSCSSTALSRCCVDLATCQGEALSVAFDFRERDWGRRAATEPVLAITKHALVDCVKASYWHADSCKISLLKITHILLLSRPKKIKWPTQSCYLPTVTLVPFPLAHIPNLPWKRITSTDKHHPMQLEQFEAGTTLRLSCQFRWRVSWGIWPFV